MLGGLAEDRTAFLAALDSALLRDAGSVVVVRIDLDRFSRIRERHGEDVYQLVREELGRRVDRLSGGHDRALRYADDAFALVLSLPDARREAVEALGTDLLERMTDPVGAADGAPIAVGSNVGLAAAASFDHVDAMRLVAGAELAVQRADSLGSRRVIVYDVPQQDDPTRIPTLYADMLTAVMGRHFHAWYQPIVGLPDRRIRGVEALVRWVHPSHGTLPPGEFIPEAERSGLVREIDTQVRREAMEACASLDQEVTLSVNLSPADLDAPRLVTDVQEALVATGITPSRLVVEVTETAVSQDWSRARRRLEALKEVGVRLAVDDFGSGHMYLDRLATDLFDVVKLDRSLVAGRSEPRSDALLVGVVGLAHDLGMQVVAEGIETEAQLERALAAGCERAQGFLFATPMTLEQLVTALAADRPL
jgi:EAL domain-containing protein (putative c-di-GMP-specific phosphodiesterase class I)/GGDEF domain-containing protein